MATPEELERAKEILEIERNLAGIRSETLNDVRDISNFLADSATSLEIEKAQRTQIRSITRDINKIAQNSYTISISELGTSKNINQVLKDRDTLEKRLASLEQLKNDLQKNGGEIQADVAENIELQVINTQKLLSELGDVAEVSAEISSKTRAFGVLEDVAKSIPGLRQFSGSFKEAADSARSVAAAGGTSASAFAAGAKSIANSAKAALPLLLLTEVIDAFIRLDAGAGKIAKQLGISYQESLKLQSSLTSIANQSGNIFVSTEKITKQFLAINDALGTRVQLEGQLLAFQTQLVEQAGIQQEAATQISLLQLATKQDAEDITKTFLGTASALNLTEGILLSERGILESISNVSDNILASFAENPKALAAAAFEAKRLGIDLNRLQGIANSLLDVETSIKNEFTAEILLGRQLNLIQARELALRKDYAGVGREIRKQGIDLAYYSKINLLQQEVLAASLGMSNDELGKQVLLNEQLSNLGLQDEEAARTRFETIRRTKGEQAAILALGNDVLANQLASASQADRFAASVDKIKEIFTGLTTALMPILDTFVSIVEVVGILIKLLDPFIQGFNVIANLANDLLGAGGNLAKAVVQTRFGNIEGARESLGNINFDRSAAAADQGSQSIANVFGMDGGDEQFFQKLAGAVESGASKANINLDGGRISKRLNAPLSIDLRRYSY